MKFEHVFLIGVGGTGSHLVDPLVRLLTHHPQGTPNITIVDGDSYEEKNENRQVFDSSLTGENKAVATAKRLGQSVRAVDVYIDYEKFRTLLDKTVAADTPFLVISAVDNHATRHALISALDDGGYENFTFISPGNSYSAGQVVVYAKENLQPMTTHPFSKYEEMRVPRDKIPERGEGCAYQVASTPQLITANASAALGVLWTVSAMLDNTGWYEELHFDCYKMKLVSQGAPKGIMG